MKHGRFNMSYDIKDTQEFKVLIIILKWLHQVLEAADGTEFRLSKGSDPKKEAWWVPRDPALAPSVVTWTRQAESCAEWQPAMAPVSMKGAAPEHALPTFTTQAAVKRASSDDLYSVDVLSELMYLEPPPAPTPDHEAMLQRCIQSGRHSKAFNKWMTPADRSTYRACGSSDFDQWWRFRRKL